MLLLPWLVLSGVARAEPPALEPLLVGRWMSVVENPWAGPVLWTSEVSADGRFVRTPHGPALLPTETGVLVASDGCWQVFADSGRYDEGIYAFNGPDIAIISGLHGTTIWARTSEPSANPARGPAYY